MKMKAMIWTGYGGPDVLQPGEIEKPVPGDNDILIKVMASTVTAGDCELRRFSLPAWIWLPVRCYMGLLKPRIKVLGQELSGVVEEVGKSVSDFKAGDKVFTAPGMKMGGYGEYVCLREKRAIALIPTNMNFGEAATIPTGGINGLHFLRKGEVKKGDHVLINGAGGSIGTYALQIAKHLGAEVTCVDSGIKLEMLTSIGADHVIDYQKEDFTRSETRYDVIIDIAGNTSYSRCVRLLNSKGRYVLGNPSFRGMIRSFWTTWLTDKKVLFEFAMENAEDFNYLKTLIEEGVIRPVIDKRYPLSELRKAHEYVEKGLKEGNVIIEIGDLK